MHNKIKGFPLEGEIGDANLVDTKDRLVRAVEVEMRDKGYVPVLDLNPDFTLNFLPEKKLYQFKLTVYGTYVGEDKSWVVEGMTNGKIQPKSTPPDKLKQSWNTAR